MDPAAPTPPLPVDPAVPVAPVESFGVDPALAGEALRDPTAILGGPQRSALLVVLLLLFWLLLRVRRQEETRGPNRPTPLSLDELGRMVFLAARSRDAKAWRGLFLNGPEATHLLGPRAESWLREHSSIALAELLVPLAQAIPPGAVFLRCTQGEDGRALLHIRCGTEERCVALGRATQVGVAYRLVGLGSEG